MKYKDDNHTTYRLEQSKDDPTKWRVSGFDKQGRSHLAMPASANPWTTEREAEHNLQILAERKRWELDACARTVC